MADDINPVTRIFIIAIMIITPLLVVVFQRLSDIREIIQSCKKGELSFNLDFLSNQNNTTDKQANQALSICPKCYKVNPRDHKFCGYCGAKITIPHQGENL